MKRFLFSVSAIALALSAGSALAADLPSMKAPPYIPPPPPMWAGFYVGLNAGGTFGGGNGVSSSGVDLFDDLAPAQAGLAGSLSSFGTASQNNGGFIGGGQVGYNWQFGAGGLGGLGGGGFVAGIEADIQGVAGSSGNAGIIGGFNDPLGTGTGNMVTTAQFHKSLDYVGTVRGRLGYLVTPTLFAYATGGLAYGGANLSSSYVTTDATGFYSPGFGGSAYSDTRVGWTVGGGLEWMFMPNWSAKIEYLYYDLGSVSTGPVVVTGTNAGALGWAYASSAATRFDGHIVRAGLNYHFNWGAPAPVLAKY